MTQAAAKRALNKRVLIFVLFAEELWKLRKSLTATESKGETRRNDFIFLDWWNYWNDSWIHYRKDLEYYIKGGVRKT